MYVTPDMLMDFEKKSVKPKVKVFLKAFVNGENKYINEKEIHRLDNGFCVFLNYFFRKI
jgi:hypothetical protein